MKSRNAPQKSVASNSGRAVLYKGGAGFLCLFLLLVLPVRSQNRDSVRTLQFSAYLETYAAADFTHPSSHRRPAFVYSHHRSGEVNVNLAYVKAAFENAHMHASLAVAAGTYMNANYAGEPATLRNLFEAWGGIRIKKQREIWLDMGVFSSHLGFESAISKDCWTVTRSIMADNSPYYESGIRLTWADTTGKWSGGLYLLNGWQQIQRNGGQLIPSAGSQVTFTPSEKIKINWSTFAGNNFADGRYRLRLFSNLYGIFQLSERSGLTVGYDYGMQVNASRTRMEAWQTAALIYRYHLAEKWYAAARAEMYLDPNEVMVETQTPQGFQCGGVSLNLDWQPSAHALIRAEIKQWLSRDDIFNNGTPFRENKNLSAVLSMAFSF